MRPTMKSVEGIHVEHHIAWLVLLAVAAALATGAGFFHKASVAEVLSGTSQAVA